MSRRIYGGEARARAYVTLVSNQGNVKRSVRDTGIPEGTLRGWMRDWDENGPPDIGDVAEAATEFVDEAVRIRDLALKELEAKLSSATPSALVATVGMLTDKVNIARGLATSRTEHVQALPPAEEIAQVLGAALRVALNAAQERDGEIIDAEILEIPAAT